MEPGQAAHPQSGKSSRGLWTRLLTAGILGPLVVAEILVPSWGVLLQATLLLFLVLAAREWAALSGVRSLLLQWLYAGSVSIIVEGLYRFSDDAGARQALAASNVALWCLVGALVVRHAKALPTRRPGRGTCLLLGLLVLGPFWLSANWLKALDARLLLAAAVLIWLADSLAYFSGRAFGKRRLAPAISPAKTWAGVGGALVAAPLVTVGLVLIRPATGLPPGPLLCLCLATVTISIVGDLLESLMKRLAGVKDSGSLLPGHGGVLDRIDSLTAAFPMFYLGISFLGSPP